MNLLVQKLLVLCLLCGVIGLYGTHPGYDQSGICEVGIREVGIRPAKDERRILDISHAYTPDMLLWDDPEGLGDYLWLAHSMKNGSLVNFSEMKMGTHTGTHVDAPGHFYQEYFKAGYDVDTLDLKILNGHALLVDVPRDTNITDYVHWKLSCIQPQLHGRTQH